MKKIGFTIGKFAPFHKGHEYLIETGIREMDKFYVVIYDTDILNIPSEKRAAWIKKRFPNVNILYAHNPPSKIGLDEESVKIQMEYLSSIIKDVPVTHFYNSEEYGKYVTKYLNIKERNIDIDRKNINISATDIRDNLVNKKEFLSEFVYNDLIN